MAPAAPLSDNHHREAHLSMSGESVKSVQLLRHHSSSHHNGQHNSIRKLRRNVLTEIRRSSGRDSSDSHFSPRVIVNGHRKPSRSSMAASTSASSAAAADSTDDEDSETPKRVRKNGARLSTSSLRKSAASLKSIRFKQQNSKDAAMAADSNLEEENSEELDAADFSDDGDRSFDHASSDGDEGMPKSVKDKKKFYYVNTNGKPSELFRTDLITRVRNGEYSSEDSDDEARAGPGLIRLNDHWRPEWDHGVQVVMNRTDLPQFKVEKSDISPIKRTPFVIPSKYIGIAPSSTIESDNSRYVSTSTHRLIRPPPRRLYEGDKIDEIYLRKLNENRCNLDRPTVTFRELLNIMDALEVDAYKNIHQQLLEPLNSPASRDDDVINEEDAACDICRGEDSEDGDDLLFCDGCNLCVHLSCYGLEDLPPDSWYCVRCEYAYGVNPPCALCPTTGGAMKSSGDKWVHIACALWLPECRFGDVEKRDRITDLDKIPDEKWLAKCVICDLRQGACIKCTAPGCKVWFHVTCALRSGYEMRIEQFADATLDGVDMISRCPKHRTEKKQSNTSRDNAEQSASASDDESESKASESLRKLESEFYLYANYEDVAKRLHYDLLIVSDVYEYWKQKREYFGNTPLIKNVHDDIIIESSQTPMLHLPSSPIFTPNVPTNTPVPLQRLRACLDKERNILTLLVRRERAKLEMFRTEKALCDNIWRQTIGSHPLSHRAIGQLIAQAKMFMVESAIAEAQQMSPFGSKKKQKTPSPSKLPATPQKRKHSPEKQHKETPKKPASPEKEKKSSPKKSLIDSLKKSVKSPQISKTANKSPTGNQTPKIKGSESGKKKQKLTNLTPTQKNGQKKLLKSPDKKKKMNGERGRDDSSSTPIKKRLRRTISKLNMRCFRIDPRIYPNRLHRVGIEGNTLFLQPSLPNAVQLWSVDTLFPQSWKCLFHVNIVEHFYSLPCCSYQSAYLYVLVIAIREGERHGRASIFRVNRDTKHSEEFRFDETTEEFLDVPWETAELTCGKDESLHIYDRAIVAGPIPFWNVIFNHTDNMFYLQRSFVPDPTGIRTDRFPILYDDPTEKTFVRMTANNSLTVFNAKEEKWEEYFPIVGSRINLASIASKGLQETMSRTGHRAGAVMSNLSIHTDGPVCIARVLLNHAHHFYRITLDHQNKEFSCEPRGVVGRLSNQKMYYTVVGEKIVAIIGLKNIIVAPLQPPTLAECCIWELQKMNSWVDENGGRSGGLSPTEIKDLLKKTFQNSQNLREIISYSV